MSACPDAAARCSGRFPSSPTASRFATSASISAMEYRPLYAAMWSAVSPFRAVTVGSALACSSAATMSRRLSPRLTA
eukprot:57178-Chlamydomonas_euryale.AAC.1